MKTHRLFSAALIAVAAQAAEAQVGVTLSGVVEMQVVHQNGGTSAVANFPPAGVQTRLDGLSSRLIFRGTEDLGAGLSAYFVLDHRFKTDTGAPTAATFWDGQSVVGLGSPYGNVYLGRDYVPAFYPGVRIDPWGYDGSIGSIVGQAWAGYNVGGGPRGANAIGYRSPRWGGLSFHVQTSRGEGVVRSTNGANIEYADGPAYAGFGYSHTSDANRAAIVSAAYDFGVMRPAMWYAVSRRAGVAGRSIALALTAPLGSGVLKAAYQVFDPDTKAGNLVAGTAAGGAERSKLALGWTHAFSRRTSITPTIAWGRQDLPALSTTTAVEVVLRHAF